MNIFLVGPMGAGKTTIGRQLAQRLNLSFLDSDHEIEARTGANIPWIFDVEGEAGFRAREARMIDELTARDGIVLATGGGAVLSPENRRHLHDRGFVVYLKTPVSLQIQRTAKDKNRPLLQTENPAAVLEKLLREREPLYEAVAHVTISTGSNNPQTVLQQILSALPEK